MTDLGAILGLLGVAGCTLGGDPQRERHPQHHPQMILSHLAGRCVFSWLPLEPTEMHG
jgi:hypothetical protein